MKKAHRSAGIALLVTLTGCGSARSLDPSTVFERATISLSDATLVTGFVEHRDDESLTVDDGTWIKTYAVSEIASVRFDTLSRQEAMLRESVANSKQAASNSAVLISIWILSTIAAVAVWY